MTETLAIWVGAPLVASAVFVWRELKLAKHMEVRDVAKAKPKRPRPTWRHVEFVLTTPSGIDVDVCVEAPADESSQMTFNRALKAGEDLGLKVRWVEQKRARR